MNDKDKKKELLYSIALLFIPIILLTITVIATKPPKQQIKINETPLTNISYDTLVKKKDVFDGVDIVGKSALVKDINTGEILYSKNSDVPLPIASITKVMTAIVFAENMQQEKITVSEEDILVYGRSLLYPGEKFEAKDLLDFTLISSSNDGASSIASNAFNSYDYPKERFVEEMNKTAKKIGMSKTYFNNETGLDINYIAGAHGSADDVSIMFEYALKNHPNLIESTKEKYLEIKSDIGLIHQATNTNKVINKLPNIIASKTGYTELAGGNLAVIIDPGLNRPISIVVLGSTREARFSDVELLAQKAIEYFENN